MYGSKVYLIWNEDTWWYADVTCSKDMPCRNAMQKWNADMKCRNSIFLLIWSSVFENSRFFNLFSLYIWEAVWLNIWYLVGEYINKDEKYYLEVDDVYESISSLWRRNSIHISSLSSVRSGNGASKRRRVRMWVVVNSNFLNKWYLRNSENIRCVFE